MSTFKIDDDVLFEGNASRGPKRKYPFTKMGVGQSFLVEVAEGETNTVVMNRVRNAVFHANNGNLGMSFTYAPWEDGIRVWRTK